MWYFDVEKIFSIDPVTYKFYASPDDDCLSLSQIIELPVSVSLSLTNTDIADVYCERYCCAGRV